MRCTWGPGGYMGKLECEHLHGQELSAPYVSWAYMVTYVDV